MNKFILGSILGFTAASVMWILLTFTWTGRSLITSSARALNPRTDSLEEFLETKQSVYEALNAHMPTSPPGVVRTNPDARFPTMAPQFQIWPPENHIEVASRGDYTYETDCRFELRLDGAAFGSEIDDGAVMATGLLYYYTKPLTALGFDNAGRPGGRMSGRTQMAWGTWARPQDSTIEITARVFVAPDADAAVVEIEIEESFHQ